MPPPKSSLIKPSKSMLFFHIWNANFSVTPINSQMYMTKPKQVQKNSQKILGKLFYNLILSYKRILLTLQTNISRCRWVAFNFIILKSVVSNRGPLCFLLKSICWFNTRTCIYSMMINHMPDQVWSSCIFAQKWISTRDRAKRCSSKSSGIG